MQNLSTSLLDTNDTFWNTYYTQSHSRFISYWLQYLQDHKTAYKLLSAEEVNIRSAWISAAKQEREAELLNAIDPLYHFYRTKGRLNEGKVIFATAVSHLTRPEEDISKQPLRRQKLYGRLLAHQAFFCHSLGQYTLTETLIEQADWLLKRCDDKRFMASLLITKGNVLLDLYGNVNEAEKLFNNSFEQYQTLEDSMGMAHALHYLAGICIWKKEFKQAEKRIQSALTICREQELGGHHMIVRFHNNLGIVYGGLGKFREAQVSFQTGYEAAYQLQDKARMAVALANQSQIALKLNNFSEALQLTHQQLHLSREIGQQFLVAGGLTNLANAYYMLGKFKLARDELRTSVDIALSINGKPMVVLALTQFAHLLYHTDYDLEAFTLLTILRPFPIAQIHQGNPENLHEILVTKLPPQTIKAIQTEWTGKNLDNAVNLMQSYMENFTFNE